MPENSQSDKNENLDEKESVIEETTNVETETSIDEDVTEEETFNPDNKAESTTQNSDEVDINPLDDTTDSSLNDSVAENIGTEHNEEDHDHDQSEIAQENSGDEVTTNTNDRATESKEIKDNTTEDSGEGGEATTEGVTDASKEETTMTTPANEGKRLTIAK